MSEEQQGVGGPTLGGRRRGFGTVVRDLLAGVTGVGRKWHSAPGSPQSMRGEVGELQGLRTRENPEGKGAAALGDDYVKGPLARKVEKIEAKNEKKE